MALTKSRNVDHFLDQELRTFKVKASTKVYRGALVGLDAATGYARGLVAGDKFVGVSYEEMDNSAGAGGAKSVRVHTLGDFAHSLSGAAQTDVGRPVFASADDTLTFVGVGNSYVGIVVDTTSSGNIILRVDPRRLVKTITEAVENLGAGADIAARAIHSFDSEAWIVAARVVNQASAAAGIDAGNTCVVALAIDAGAVAGKTFNNTVPFPDANTVSSLGTITNGHSLPGNVLTLAVTNGATADPGPFIVEADYV